MATPWERISDDVYKEWLLEAMTAEEYNGESPLNRRTLRTQFQQQQQQQEQQQQDGPTDEQMATPGSKSRPSRAALQRLVEEIQATKFVVNWCSHGAISPSKIQDSKVSRTNNFLELLRRNLGGWDDWDFRSLRTEGETKFPKFSSDSQELDALNFRLLRTQGETIFQKGHLQKHFFNVQEAKALDLSSDACDGPFFKPATKVSGGYVVSAKTAKPNGTSIVVPMDIEIQSDAKDSDDLAKVDFEVLQQAVERLKMRMLHQGYLKMAFAFAVTGRSAWYLIVERPETLETPKLWVDRVEHGDVGKLWMHLTKFAQRRAGFFLF